MSEQDNGFNKAQRAYDNQLPPEGDEYEDCEVCEGTGIVDCECSECDECNGTGQINISAAKREAYEEYLESKAEEARYEQLMEQQNDMKIGSDTDKFLDRGIEE